MATVWMQSTLDFDSFEGKMLKNGAVFMVKAVQKQLDKDREKMLTFPF